MSRIAILALLMLAAPVFADDLSAIYAAHTETDVNITLELKPSGKVMLEIDELGEPDGGSHKEFRGTWRKVRGTLVVRLGADELRYAIVDCLSYSDIGWPGCSLGFKPESAKLQSGLATYKYLLMSNALWKANVLGAVLSHKLPLDNASNKP